MAQEMSKGLKMALGLFGITPEMLADPALLLRQFGINPADLHKFIADIQQIGLIAQSIDALLRHTGSCCERMAEEI